MAITKMHRSACLTNYVEVAQALHVSPFDELRRVKLNPASLTNPDTWVPASALFRLLENSAQTAGVDNFGLRMAEGRKLSNLGPLAVVLRSQPTMRKALEAMRQYCHLQAEEVTLLFEENDGVLCIREELTPDQAEPMRQATELSLGVLFRALRVLLGDKWQPTVVCFRHAPPRDASLHRRVFDTRLRFNSTIDGIVCQAANLDEPLPSYDPEIARYMRKLLEVVNTQPTQSASEKVRQLVWALLPTGRCSLEVVAQHLGMDRRTLHRHLQRDGRSFSEIVDDVRCDLAIRHLSQPDRPFKDLSELLGFSELSAFSRWFARRYGCTATAWRLHKSSAPAPPRSARAGSSGRGATRLKAGRA